MIFDRVLSIAIKKIFNIIDYFNKLIIIKNSTRTSFHFFLFKEIFLIISKNS